MYKSDNVDQTSAKKNFEHNSAVKAQETCVVFLRMIYDYIDYAKTISGKELAHGSIKVMQEKQILLSQCLSRISRLCTEDLYAEAVEVRIALEEYSIFILRIGIVINQIRDKCSVEDRQTPTKTMLERFHLNDESEKYEKLFKYFEQRILDYCGSVDARIPLSNIS